MAREISNRELFQLQDDPVSSPRMILGSGRSGTTWVLDCLAEANELRPVFEPLHPKESEMGAKYAYDVLSASDSAEDLQKYLADIAAGEVHSRWIDYRGPRGLVYPNPKLFANLESARRWLSGWRKYRRRKKALKPSMKRPEVLVKCIRGNLMAGWFSRKLAYRTVLTVRHPCSVVESQLRLGKAWDPTSVLTQYRQNARLHELTNGRYLELLNSKLSRIEALTLNWVIENQFPIERSAVDGYSVIFYEDLVSRGDANWPLLCDCLGLQHVPPESMLRKPSQQSAQKPKYGNEKFHLPSWQKRLVAEQLRTVQRILDSLEFTVYSVDSGDATV